jgi:hypothetical protein
LFNYLKTGKVPGARTIEDVKAFYEQQVPAGRGCTDRRCYEGYFIYPSNRNTKQGMAYTGKGRGQVMLK